MMIALTDLNDCMEEQEKKRRETRRKRRGEGVLSESLVLKCKEAGYGFVG